MRQVLVVVILILFVACKHPGKGNPIIEIQTKFGDIQVELFIKQAPITAGAFLSYVDSGFYRDSYFYRALKLDNQPSNAPKTELIQGGIWKSNYKKEKELPGIQHETTQQTGIQHLDGVISLARLAPGTASTEFFICIGKQAGLDYGGENVADKEGYAAFGRVVTGMDVVRKIYRQNDNDQYFYPLVPIYDIIRK